MSDEWYDPVASHGSALFDGKKVAPIPFDPLNLASEENLAKYREAEIKHGRLAMLAALGWPAAEEIEPLLAKFTGATDELAETAGRAPSLLNGGLEEAQIPLCAARSMPRHRRSPQSVYSGFRVKAVLGSCLSFLVQSLMSRVIFIRLRCIARGFLLIRWLLFFLRGLRVLQVKMVLRFMRTAVSL